MKQVLLGITGSIAAYKAADIASGLTGAGCAVHAVMTRAATGFVTPLTLQALTRNRVFVDTLQEDDPSEIVHVNLVQRCDVLLVAPATANHIGKIAHGIADDMLTSMVLAAHGIPLLLAPAMNTHMYENVAVQENLATLRRRGWQVIEPKEARLACGIVGKGALANTEAVVAAALAAMETRA
ncbi:MAG: flavoprotein [Oscillospiraceae bacterium]|jgi:phosphopantothenoylcysteine decarboxylase/phosphopantothenoylcysteine decarboxylase/phosphopantothenate--cysteine ligase